MCRLDPVLRDRLAELEIPFETEESEGGAGSELREQVEAIERWYLNDWMALDAKLRTSIVEGISVFPLALRSAASREHVLSAASGPGRIHTYV